MPTYRHRRTLGALLITGAALAGTLTATLTAPEAWATARSAAPAPSPAPQSSVQLTWQSSGLPASVELAAANSAQSYAVPVPTGLTPTALTGVIRQPVDTGAGFVEVDTGDGAVLGSIPLPASGANDALSVPFSVPLSGVPVTDRAATIIFTLRQTGTGAAPSTATAAQCGPVPDVQLSSLSTTFSGTATAPTTIASFLPPVAGTITMAVPDRPSLAVQDAVVQLASALVASYRPVPVQVSVVGTEQIATAANGPLDRLIVVSDGGAGGLRIGTVGGRTALLITGDSASLPEQTQLFTDRLPGFVQAPSATVAPASEASDAPGQSVLATDTVTFSQLGMSASTSVLGQTQVSMSLDQGLFAAALSSAEVDLVASYTPVVSPAVGTVSVTSSGVTLATATLGRSGRVQLRFTVPQTLMRARTGLQLNLTYSPQGQGACAYTTPTMSFAVDPRSTVTVHRSSSPQAGFAALPQALLPAYQVALADGTETELDYATRFVTGLQADTVGVLHPSAVSLAVAAHNRVPSVIVAPLDDARAAGLNPPLGGTVRTPQLNVTVDEDLASVQVFADSPRDRTVVLITADASWSRLDPVFALHDADHPWSSVSGDVAAAGPDGVAVTAALRAGSPPAFTPTTSRSWLWWYYAAAVLAGVLVLLAAGYLAGGWRARRATTGPMTPSPDGPSTNGPSSDHASETSEPDVTDGGD